MFYKEDLQLFPNNIWSLTGLTICYRGLKNAEGVAALAHKLTAARKVSDVAVGASCACAVEHWNAGVAVDCSHCKT